LYHNKTDKSTNAASLTQPRQGVRGGASMPAIAYLRKNTTPVTQTDLPDAGTTQLQPAVFQLQIINSQVKEQVRANYQGKNIDPITLNILLQDAFDNTSSFEEAVKRIDNGLMHENSMFGTSTVNDDDLMEDETPVNDTLSITSVNKRPKIGIDKKEFKGNFKSSVPEIETDDKDILEEWGGLKNVSFYEKTRASLKIARDSGHEDHDKEQEKLDKLINAYRDHPKVKKLIDEYVRVPAKKAKGASSGTGLDELLKTSETMKYLELSYRPPLEKSAIATFKDEEFDWMDVQQQLRLSTEFIVWAGDLVGEISGHTGTFQRKYKSQWMTSKQDLMHSIRDNAVTLRSNPATGMIEALVIHLRITENVEGLGSIIYKGTEAKDALMTTGRSIEQEYDKMVKDLGKHRDVIKTYIEVIRSNVETTTPSSPMQGRLGSEDTYYPESPKQNDDEIEINEKTGKVKGNPLPSLASQWRLEHEGDPMPIPAKPVHPAIKKAREDIKKTLGTPVSKSINDAGKRLVKKSDEDTDWKEKDSLMLQTYLNKLSAYKEIEGVNEIIEELKLALLQL
jgi:hypothetical protein